MNNKEAINKVIDFLNDLKNRNNIEELEINIIPDMVREFQLLGEGNSYAYKNINIDITYKDLYVKDINNVFGRYELYNKDK